MALDVRCRRALEFELSIQSPYDDYVASPHRRHSCTPRRQRHEFFVSPPHCCQFVHQLREGLGLRISQRRFKDHFLCVGLVPGEFNDLPEYDFVRPRAECFRQAFVTAFNNTGTDRRMAAGASWSPPTGMAVGETSRGVSETFGSPSARGRPLPALYRTPYFSKMPRPALRIFSRTEFSEGASVVSRGSSPGGRLCPTPLTFIFVNNLTHWLDDARQFGFSLATDLSRGYRCSRPGQYRP